MSCSYNVGTFGHVDWAAVDVLLDPFIGTGPTNCLTLEPGETVTTIANIEVIELVKPRFGPPRRKRGKGNKYHR